MTVRSRIRVTGIVQGVGFRPFVHGVAAELGLAGFVGNDESGVVIEAEGPAAAVEALVTALRERPPPLACVTGVTADGVPVQGGTGFGIAPSTANGHRVALVAADTATCADCLTEMRDPADRRYRHPFITCTNCGPRFTIVTGVPYDRPATTMAGFPMCAACAAEYARPGGPAVPRAARLLPGLRPDPAVHGPTGRPDPRRGRRPSRRSRDRREGTRRLPPRGACRRRAGRGRAAGAQAPGGQAVRCARARPGRGAGVGRGRRGRGRRADVPPRADRAAAQAAGTPRSPLPSLPATTASGCCCRTRRSTTCLWTSSPPPSC